MFGYILPLKNELKVYEFEYFRSYYHGLCYSIKNNFGNIPRLTLSYDLTFISFLLDSLYDKEITTEKKRCIKHPTYDIFVAENTEALDYISNLSIIFSELKLKDNIKDDNNLNSKIFYLFLKPSNKKIYKECTKIKDMIYDNMNILDTLEINNNFEFIDEVTHPFSNIMGNILKEYPYELPNDNSELRENLYLLGYNIGRYIYLMDAFDDLEEDIKNNKFNPFNKVYNNSNMHFQELINKIISDIERLILGSISIAIDILNKLPIKKHYSILNNVFSLGMPNKYYEVLQKNIPPK